MLFKTLTPEGDKGSTGVCLGEDNGGESEAGDVWVLEANDICDFVVALLQHFNRLKQAHQLLVFDSVVDGSPTTVELFAAVFDPVFDVVFGAEFAVTTALFPDLLKKLNPVNIDHLFFLFLFLCSNIVYNKLKGIYRVFFVARSYG